VFDGVVFVAAPVAIVMGPEFKTAEPEVIETEPLVSEPPPLRIKRDDPTGEALFAPPIIKVADTAEVDELEEEAVLTTKLPGRPRTLAPVPINMLPTLLDVVPELNRILPFAEPLPV